MTRKHCTKCGETKPADKDHWYFTNGKPTSGPCKECRKRVALEQYRKDPEKGKARMKKWREQNPEKVREGCKRWRNENPELVRQINQKKYAENREAYIAYERERRQSGIAAEQARARFAADPEKYRERRRITRAKSRDRINQWMREYRKANPEQFRKYEADRYERDPHRKIAVTVSAALLAHIQKNGMRKSKLRRDMFGWTIKELAAHLERLFEDGMSWDNYGEWHIDHIIPKSAVSSEFLDDDLLRDIWALTNLAPLWAKDNLEKHARLDWVLPDTYKNPELRKIYAERNEILLIFG